MDSFQQRIERRFAWNILGRVIDETYEKYGVYLHIFCYSHVGLPQSHCWSGVWAQHPVPELGFGKYHMN